MTENEIHDLLGDVHWLRALARRLARDPDTADDLVQEACAIALRQDPPPQHWRSWLVGVLRTLVRAERRGTAVRQQRHAAAARDAEAEATETLVQRAEVQQLLAQAVLQLDEPYRATVLLRYFEGEPPRRIAARHGVPVATVHSRLQRAVQQLRERLDRDAGGRARWLALTVPFAWPRRAPAPTAAAAGTLRLSFAAVLVLAVGGAVWWWRTAPALPAPAPATTTAAVPAAAPVPPPAAPTVAAERTAVPPPAVDAAAPALHAVRGRVVDADGRAVAGLAISALLSSSPAVADARELRARFAESGADGGFVGELPGPVAFLMVQDRNLANVMIGTWTPGSTVVPLLVVAPRLRLAGRASTADGRPLLSGRIQLELPEDFWTRLPARVDRAQALDCATEIAADGAFAFDEVPLVAGAGLVATAAGCTPLRLPLPPASTADLRLVLDVAEAPRDAVHGRVQDAFGRPAAGAMVACGAEATRSGSDGTFVLLRPRAGAAAAVVAAVPGFAPAHGTLPAPGATDFVLQLGAETATLHGRVVDAAGPVAGARVWIADPTPFGAWAGSAMLLEYFVGGAPLAAGVEEARSAPPAAERSLGTSWTFASAPTAAFAFATTDGDGRFTVPGLLDRAYVLRAFDPRTGRFGERAAVRAATDTTLVLDDGIVRDLRGRVVAVDGTPIAAARLRQRFELFRHRARLPAGTRETIHMLDGPSAATDADGRFALLGVRLPESMFVVEGDTILPTQHSVTAAGQELQVTVERRCAVEVVLPAAGEADAVRCRDAAGKAVWLARVHGGGMDAQPVLPLHDGRSGVFVVGERAATLVLMRSDVPVREVPIVPDPQRTTFVQ
ncbi:MAG: sigma-70 family RNA polymerase sigma factor [Planctomycetes bacterium]|nr:sigma-70 family RNA polymerase sigma factor [Planctomycetota bacterium]